VLQSEQTLSKISKSDWDSPPLKQGDEPISRLAFRTILPTLNRSPSNCVGIVSWNTGKP
jgi:hypothetical protein